MSRGVQFERHDSGTKATRCRDAEAQMASSDLYGVGESWGQALCRVTSMKRYRFRSNRNRSAVWVRGLSSITKTFMGDGAFAVREVDRAAERHEAGSLDRLRQCRVGRHAIG